MNIKPKMKDDEKGFLKTKNYWMGEKREIESRSPSSSVGKSFAKTTLK